MQSHIEILDRMTKLCQERSQIIQQLIKEAITPYDQAIAEHRDMLRIVPEDKPPALVPTEEERDILNLYDDLEEGAKLSTGTIAKMLDDSPTNGKLKRTLAEMVRKGFLRNEGSGYERIWWPSSPPNNAPAA